MATMSISLPSHRIGRSETRAARHVSRPAADAGSTGTSPQLLVFAWIWAAVIAYFAVQGALG
jgi:hypothetical protein